jgi:hypothetical protein
MPNKTSLHFPDEIKSNEIGRSWQDGYGHLHCSAHQALLTDTLDMCGCGDYEASVNFVLEAAMTGLRLTDQRYNKHIERMIQSKPGAAVDILLHWLFEEELIAHGSCLSQAWVDVAGVETAHNGALPQTSCIPETIEDDLVALMQHCLDNGQGSLTTATQVYLLSDLPRAARLLMVLLYERGIIKASGENTNDIQLTLRGLQLAGIAHARKGFLKKGNDPAPTPSLAA